MNVVQPDFVTHVTSALVSHVLDTVTTRVQRAISGTDKQQAIRRCLQAGIVALVTASFQATPNETDLLVEIFDNFFDNADVAKEIGQLLRGHALNMDELATLFEDSGYDTATLPGVNFRDGMLAFEAAFVEAASEESALQGIIQTNQLLAQTHIQRELSTAVRDLVRFLHTVIPDTVGIQAGKVTAQRVDTGQPVQYQWDLYIDRRIQAQSLAHDAEARMDAGDWEEAEDLLLEALRLNPELPIVRTSFALRLSEVVAARFRRDHGERDTASELIQAVDAARHGRQLIPSIPPVIESFVWLLDALQHDGDSGGQVSASLALMYGVTKRPRKMLRCVRTALTANPRLREYFLDPHQLPLLAHGSGNDKDALRELGMCLGVELPASKGQVLHSLETMDLDDLEVNLHGIVWSVMGQPTRWVGGPSPAFPAPVRIFVREESGQHLAQACYTVPIPYQPLKSSCVPDIPDHPGEMLPMKELVRELTSLFLFVCPL